MKEITSKSASDLSRMLTEKREALRTFRFGSSGSKTKNVKEGKATRKDIARILTVLNKKESQAARSK